MGVAQKRFLVFVTRSGGFPTSGIAGNLVLVDNSDSFFLERSKFSFLSAKPTLEANLRSVGVDFSLDAA